MSELDELRTQNKELKRLLENALDLLEKSKLALTGQAQSPPTAAGKKKAVVRSRSKSVPRKAPRKKKT